MPKFRFQVGVMEDQTGRLCMYVFVKQFPSMGLAGDYLHAVTYTFPEGNVKEFNVKEFGKDEFDNKQYAAQLNAAQTPLRTDWMRRDHAWTNEIGLTVTPGSGYL